MAGDAEVLPVCMNMLSAVFHTFICWGSRVIVGVLCCRSSAPCASEGDLCAGTAFIWRVISIGECLGGPL